MNASSSIRLQLRMSRSISGSFKVEYRTTRAAVRLLGGSERDMLSITENALG